VEDIAKAAGVSVPTAYNHFPGGKQELIGAVYAPLLVPLAEAVDADIAQQRDPVEAVSQHIRDMAVLMRQHQALTATLVAAVSEQTARVGPPTDPGDVRNLVPATTPLIRLIKYGQAQGAFRSDPSAEEVGAYHGNGLLLRALTRPSESAQATGAMILSQLVPALSEY
jgi:AcrR family transcriptional regulator